MGKGLRGPKPKIKNPGKLFARLMKYILANYKFHIIFVVAGILAGVLANVRGTLFMQTLIDVYILPMIGAEHPDFGPLAAAIFQVALIYGIGAFSTWGYNRLMVKVTQGTLQNLRDDMFTHMESLWDHGGLSPSGLLAAFPGSPYFPVWNSSSLFLFLPLFVTSRLIKVSSAPCLGLINVAINFTAL